MLRASEGVSLEVMRDRLDAVDEGRDWQKGMNRNMEDPAVRQALNADAWLEQDPQSEEEEGKEDNCLPF